MCNTARLHEMFKQASNKYDSNQYQDFPTQHIDDFLYDAQLDYIRLCVTTQPKNQYQIGFASNQQRIDMIQPFIKSVNINPIYNKTRGKTKVTVFKLPKDYYITNQEIYSLDKCRNIIKIDIVQYNNLNTHLNNKEQLLWSQAYATQKDNELHVFYPDQLIELSFEYVQLPRKTFYGGYDTLEYIQGNPDFPNQLTPRINSMVPDAYCHILIDIAVQNVFGNLRDYNLAQFKQQNLNL